MIKLHNFIYVCVTYRSFFAYSANNFFVIIHVVVKALIITRQHIICRVVRTTWQTVKKVNVLPHICMCTCSGDKQQHV